VIGAAQATMNHSIYSADRATHLKVVAVALAAGIAIAGLAMASRANAGDPYPETAGAIRQTMTEATTLCPGIPATSVTRMTGFVESCRTDAAAWDRC
jgi:hypothetical protein